MPRRKRSAGLEPRTARDDALRALARRPLSVAELRQRLLRRGHSEVQVDDAVAMGRDYGYLNDEALAEAVLREAESAGRGPLWVEHKLLSRGVAEALARRTHDKATALAAERARQIIVARFGQPGQLNGAARKQAFRLLTSRGFPNELVSDILPEVE